MAVLKRRKLIQGIGVASFSSLVSPRLFASRLLQEDISESGQEHLFLFVTLDGGWDVSQLCVPCEKYISGYDPDEVTSKGAFQVAPTTHWPVAVRNELGWTVSEFFDRFADDLLQVDGVRSALPIHQASLKEIAYGLGSRSDLPNIAALVASEASNQMPFPYFTDNAYSETRGIVQRIPFETEENFLEIVNPILSSYGDVLIDEKLWTIVKNSSDKHFVAKRNTSTLKADRDSISSLLSSRQDSEKMRALESSYRKLRTMGLSHQFSVTLGAFENGLGKSASIRLKGFDTHSNHFGVHSKNLGIALKEMITAFSYMKACGILKRCTILVASEFGRTPFYGGGDKKVPVNRELGKDHFVDSSFFLLGRGVRGNRRIGAIDREMNSQKISLSTLQADHNGQILTWANVHASIRDLYRVKQSRLAEFSLEGALPAALFDIKGAAE